MRWPNATSLALLLCVASTVCAVRAVRAAEMRATVTDQHGKPVADAVLLATPLDAKYVPHGKPATSVVDQIDKEFVPWVRVIYKGSSVRFPNKDSIRHQVYSFSAAKKFELPLYAGTQAMPVTFDTPGVVVLGCNIHDWMLGYIYVAETPFFAQTTADGRATLEDLPSGAYSFRIWHPGMDVAEAATVKRQSLSAAEIAHLDWRITLKPILRIPRVSGDAGASYP